MTIEEAFPSVQFPIAGEAFRRLPRHAGYRYDHIGGEAHLTPEPRQYHCVLTLRPREARSSIKTSLTDASVRPMSESDWPVLGPVYERAFCQSTPLGQASDQEAGNAASRALDQTQSGGSGLLIPEACFVATGTLPAQSKAILGGILITLLPHGDLEGFDDPAWTEAPPPDAIARRWGRPHLTWIFVDPWIGRYGVASSLLDHAANVLCKVGYSELASTFLLGNESSTLWHWRNGFRLVSYVASPRRINQRHAKTPEKRVE